MSTKRERRPAAVMLSKRANVFYLEHVRVVQKDERVVYLTEKGGGELLQVVNIPDKNTAMVLLGKGSSITDAAVRKLAESNVVIGFCGSGGSPMFGALDLAFITPQDEYRPTEYAQAWMRMWLDEGRRLDMAAFFLRERITWNRQVWQKEQLPWPDQVSDTLIDSLGQARNVQELLSREAHLAKRLYAVLAQHYHVDRFSRIEGKRMKGTPAEAVNSFLDHGNYIAYGYAAVALHGLGIPYSLPVLHGKTRRGALVFDVADLVKDGLVMPLAFEYGRKKAKDNEFRAALIDRAQRLDVLDYLFGILEKAAK